MNEATALLQTFRDRLKQLHVSEVNIKSNHERISAVSVRAFARIYHLIPDDVPVILETPVSADNIEDEIEQVRKALPPQGTDFRDLIEGSLDILWANHEQPEATPQYLLHFLRYVGFKDGGQPKTTLSGKNALEDYLKRLNVSDKQLQIIFDGVQKDKSFDIPNVFMPKELALTYDK